MNKLLLAFLVLSTSAISFQVLHQTTERAKAELSSIQTELNSGTQRLADLNKTKLSLRNEVMLTKRQLNQASSSSKPNFQLFGLLEGKSSEPKSRAWGELREQLGIGWDSSADYVLVGKRVLNKISLPPLNSNGRVSDIASVVLATSPDERSEIEAAIDQFRSWTLSQVHRAEAVGDIVAQYIIPADPKWEMTISNAFSAKISDILGAQRSDVFLKQAWSQLRPGSLTVVGEEPVTMTIRRSVANGEPSLSWHLKQGARSSVPSEVSYGVYPSAWFLLLFPGGWNELAAREGFELPREFHKRR